MGDLQISGQVEKDAHHDSMQNAIPGMPGSLIWSRFGQIYIFFRTSCIAWGPEINTTSSEIHYLNLPQMRSLKFAQNNLLKRKEREGGGNDYFDENYWNPSLARSIGT